MLAIKFYNLQALIHRPLMSPSKLLRSCPETVEFYRSERESISTSKRKCVKAAQCTARLLHNIEDKHSLVHGFPWWQMISCLISASSILMVASICIDSNLDEKTFNETDWLAVDEDAEVCLQVFQALSSNSNAARLARDMLQRLKSTRSICQGEHPKLLCECLLLRIVGPRAKSHWAMSGNLDSVLWRERECRIARKYTFSWTVTNLHPICILGRVSSFPEVATMLQVPEAPSGSIGTLSEVALGHTGTTMPPTLDCFSSNQESFNLMFQTMPYEMSEPLMCKYMLSNVPRCGRSCCLESCA